MKAADNNQQEIDFQSVGGPNPEKKDLECAKKEIPEIDIWKEINSSDALKDGDSVSEFSFIRDEKAQEIDPDEEYWQAQRKYNGVFDCHGGFLNEKGNKERYQYSKTSLYCMSDENCIRKIFVWIATWRWFEYFVTVAIIVNSIMLGTTDYQTRLDPTYQSTWTPKQEKIDVYFSAIFISECIVKVISMGFCMHKMSYLREPWNCLDFFIVCVSIVGFLPIKGGSDSLKSLRTFRILRPLRSINKLPAMKQQIQSLLGSIPGLMRVFFFIIFIFSIFAIFGTNQFMGQQYQFCRSTMEPEYKDGVFKVWTKLVEDEDGPVLCQVDSDCATSFPNADVAICGSVYSKTGLDPVDNDGVRDIELIMYGIPGFDNVAQGFLAIFQVLTLESWVYLMYNFSDAGSGGISVIFFTLVVIIGAFFTMNLVLAIIVDAFNSYNREKEIKDKEKQELLKQQEEKQLKQNQQMIKEKTEDELKEILIQANIDKLKRKYPQFFDDDSGEESEYEETMEQKFLRLTLKVRLQRSCFLTKVHDFVSSALFNFLIFLLIIGNTMTLAAYTYNQSDEKTEILNKLNVMFTWIFFGEMCLKLIGLGKKNYFADGYNRFDAIIVFISLADYILSKIPSLDVGSILNAFRALRLLRMLKLAKAWKALADILQKTAKSLKDVSNFSLLLFLFMYIFALLGMELFANIALIDENDNLVIGEQAVMELYASGDFYTFPRDNFNNVGWALSTVFIIIIGEDWNWTMYQWVRAYGYSSSVSYHIAIYFFVILMIFGNIVLFSLFTAILLQNFQGDDEDEEDDKQKQSPQDLNLLGDNFFTPDLPKPPSKWEKFMECFNEAFGPKEPEKKEDSEGSDMPYYGPNMPYQLSHGEEKGKKIVEGVKLAKKTVLPHYENNDTRLIKRGSTLLIDEAIINQLDPLMGTSTCCLGPENSFRLYCHKLAENKWFQNIIVLLILISTIMLALETPLDNPESNKIKILEKIDIFMTSAFTFEMAVKIIARGFAFAGKDSYIRIPWNILDFVIVMSALMSILASDLDIGFFKSLRILRILRPLRLIARNKGLKVAITALGASLPNIMNLQVIVLFFIFLFAILQTTLLSGSFNSCSTDHLNLSMKQQIGNIHTMWDCINYGGEWTKPDLNFDTTIDSLLTMMTIQTTEGWTDAMWNSVDAVGPYQQPIENNNIFMVVYTQILILIICMLFIELFVGIVTETFNNQKELMSGNKLLDTKERAWLQIQLMAWNSSPKGRGDNTGKCRVFFQTITDSKWFDNFIIYCIMGNTFILAFSWYMQPESFMGPIDAFNYLFMLIFTVEAVIKIIALGKHYFDYSWNRFDFFIVVCTIIVLIISWSGVGEDLEILGTVIRTLRICRVLRLVNKNQNLQTIFATLLQAAPAMGSLGLLLMLLIFMFSIIGMAQFALINLDGAAEMNAHANFQSFSTSFLTLLRCSNGEAWNAIMFDSYQSNSILYQCNETEDYYSIIERGDDPTDPYGPKGCGSMFAVAFHIIFQVIVSQVFLNLFIAIIIDAFFGQTDLAKIPLKQHCFDDFTIQWSNYDRDRNGMIYFGDLQKLFLRLTDKEQTDPALAGVFMPFKKQLKNDKKFMNRLLMSLEIPIFIKIKKDGEDSQLQAQNNGLQPDRDDEENKNQSQESFEKEKKEKDSVQVKFHDVLLKLSFMSVRIFYLGKSLKQIKTAMEVMKRTTGTPIHSDFLEAYDWYDPLKPNEFDSSMIGLQKKLNEKKPRSDLLVDLKEIIRKRIKEDKQIDTVATNKKEIIKAIGEDEFAKKYGNDFEVEVYTTRYYVSALMIYEYIQTYNQRIQARNQRRTMSRRSSSQGSLLSFNLSHQQNDSQIASDQQQRRQDPNLPSTGQQPSSGVTASMPEPCEDENNRVQDANFGDSYD